MGDHKGKSGAGAVTSTVQNSIENKIDKMERVAERQLPAFEFSHRGADLPEEDASWFDRSVGLVPRRPEPITPEERESGYTESQVQAARENYNRTRPELGATIGVTGGRPDGVQMDLGPYSDAKNVRPMLLSKRVIQEYKNVSAVAEEAIQGLLNNDDEMRALERRYPEARGYLEYMLSQVREIKRIYSNSSNGLFTGVVFDINGIMEGRTSAAGVLGRELSETLTGNDRLRIALQGLESQSEVQFRRISNLAMNLFINEMKGIEWRQRYIGRQTGARALRTPTTASGYDY